MEGWTLKHIGHNTNLFQTKILYERYRTLNVLLNGCIVNITFPFLDTDWNSSDRRNFGFPSQAEGIFQKLLRFRQSERRKVQTASLAGSWQGLEVTELPVSPTWMGTEPQSARRSLGKDWHRREIYALQFHPIIYVTRRMNPHVYLLSVLLASRRDWLYFKCSLLKVKDKW